MPLRYLLHLHLPRFHVHSTDWRRSGGSRGAAFSRDVEHGLRNITGPTHVRPLDDTIDFDSTAHHDEEPTKTYRLLPILSGVMVPFSIMLSIPSLIGHWHIRTENNVTTGIRPNPFLLDIAVAFSTACGFLACAFLVIRFAERCVKSMTLAAIAFLTLHDIINTTAVTTFGIFHRFDDGFTYGPSFWFTVCSTTVSIVTSITLAVDYIFTKDFAHSGSGLTPKQRSLVIAVIILLSYISFGSLIEAKLLNITFLDALYFSVVAIETIGFGDIYPSSTKAKIFNCFYITGGILNIALGVAMARDAILESAAVEIRRRLKQRQHERRIRSRWRAAIRWRLRERRFPVWIHHHRHAPPGEHPHHQRWYDRLSRIWDEVLSFTTREPNDPAWKFQHGPRQRRLNLEALTEADWHAAALEAGAPVTKLVPQEIRKRNQESICQPVGIPLSRRPTMENGQGMGTSHSLTHVRLGGILALLGNFATAVTYGTQPEPESEKTLNSTNPNNTAIPEAPEEAITVNEGPEGQLDSPRLISHGVPLTISPTIQEDDHFMENFEEDTKKLFTARLCMALLLFIIFWLAGSTIFMKTEKWTFGTAAYFCFVSFVTVGFGDLSPKTPAGRSIFVVWALLGVATMTILFSVLLEAYSRRYESMIKSQVYQASPVSNVSRHPLSRYPTFSSTVDHGGRASPIYMQTHAHRSTPGDLVNHDAGRSTPRIRIHTPTPVGSETVELKSDGTPDSRPVLLQVDHLRSLITMARAHRDSEVDDPRKLLEDLTSHLEKML